MVGASLGPGSVATVQTSPFTRPWLFLDLDGVISPLPPRDVEDPEEKFRIPAGHMSWPRALYRIHVDERLPDWATQLDHGRLRFKAQAIHARLQADPRPFAWADDHLARGTPPPPICELALEHLFIRPRPLIGLTAEHIAQLLTFGIDSGSKVWIRN